jgi:XrtJ-associated TM-motif-TM protein
MDVDTVKRGRIAFLQKREVNKLMKLFYVAMVGVALIAVASPALGPGGCIDSPENPTLILALVGSASGAMVALRARLRRNK